VFRRGIVGTIEPFVAGGGPKATAGGPREAERPAAAADAGPIA
jgi:hypothetical protein